MKTINCVDILLPKVNEPEKWAVVSCDQFTSQRDYWKELNDYIGDAPSALKLIFPEVYLSDKDADERIKKINIKKAGKPQKIIFFITLSILGNISTPLSRYLFLSTWETGSYNKKVKK